MFKNKVAIIGVGNMGKALAEGLLNTGTVNKRNLILSNSSKTNKQAAKQASYIILSVKPNVIRKVCKEIGPVLRKNAVIISIAAGVSISKIEKWLGKHKSLGIARVMTNTPSQIGLGMSGWTTNQRISKKQKKNVQKILQALGKEVYFHNENMVDKVTAISGSGPAYFFYIVESLIEATKSLGLNHSQAEELIYQTFKGSTELLLQSSLSASDLRKAVTSKGGITEAAIKYFQSKKLKDILEKGIQTAYKRSQHLT